MKIVTVKHDLLSIFSCDSEVLIKERRPCVLLLQLHYKDRILDFAVPFRSNIPPNTPKQYFFKLPPRKTTKPKHRHGIHFIKMFPIIKPYIEVYNIQGNSYYMLIQRIIDKNTKIIVTNCQEYLNLYASGNKPLYSTDIDLLISILDDQKELK